MDTKASEYRRGRHVVYEITVHVVLVTKYRRGPITDRVRELLVQVTQEVCERHKVELLEADGEADHLHLLLSLPPAVSVSKIIGAIKTNTSRVVRQQGWPEVTTQLWGDHFWSPSYFVASTGGAPLERVREYIRQQREPSRGPGRPKRAPGAG